MNAAAKKTTMERRSQVARRIDRCLLTLTAEKLSTAVSAKVVGQDEAVRRVSLFLMTALRRIRLVASGTPSSDLPHIGSLLLEGPSGCGKTLIVETACSVLGGLQTYAIDGSTVTGAGWRGGELDDHKYQLAKMQSEPGAGPIVVFIDEADKLPKAGNHPRDGFDPCEQFLKLIEGDSPEMIASSGKSAGESPLLLDRATLVFIFAGAFTGLDSIIRSRIIGESGGSTAGFSAGVEALGALSFDEDELRVRSQPEDLISWGLPRELVGRITSIARVRPLSEEDLLSITMGGEHSIESRFAKMMPPGCHFSVDAEAARRVVGEEASSGRGARGVEAALTPISCDAVELAATDESVISVSVVQDEAGLCLEVERGEREISDELYTKEETGPSFPSTPSDRTIPEDCNEVRAWAPPSWTGGNDDLSHVAVRLAVGRDEGSPDPLATVQSHSSAKDMASAIVEVTLTRLPASEARIAWELIYGCISYALEWGAPGDVNTRVLTMLLREAAEGKLLDRVLEVWDGESRSRRGEPSNLRRGVLNPGERRRHGHLEYSGTDAGNDPALKHILFFYALSGKRATRLSRKIVAGVESLCGAKADG